MNQKQGHIKNPSKTKSNTLRILAIPLLALLVIEIILGSLLADQRVANLPYDSGLYNLHAIVKLLLIAVNVIALIVSIRLPSWRNRVAVGLSFGSTVGATIAGLAYQADNILIIDAVKGGLSGLVLIAAILLLVWGSVAKPNSPATTG